MREATEGLAGQRHRSRAPTDVLPSTGQLPLQEAQRAPIRPTLVVPEEAAEEAELGASVATEARAAMALLAPAPRAPRERLRLSQALAAEAAAAEGQTRLARSVAQAPRDSKDTPKDTGSGDAPVQYRTSIHWKTSPQGVEYVEPGEDIQEALDRVRCVLLCSGQHYANGLRLRQGQILAGLGYSSHLVLNAPIIRDDESEYSQAMNGTIADMRISGTSSCEAAIRLVNVYRCTVSGVFIDGAGEAFTDACIEIRNTGAYNCAAICIRDVHLQNGAGAGFRSYRADPGAGPSTILITGGRIQAMSGYGIDMAAGQVDVQALEFTVQTVDIEGCRGGIRGSFHSGDIRSCHFEQGAVALPDDAHIAIVGARRCEAFNVSGCLFSGSAPYSINIGDPSPGGSTIGRGVSFVGNKFSSYGTAALRIRHCTGVTVRGNRDSHNVLVTPQDSWEHNAAVDLQGSDGSTSSPTLRVVDDDYTATMFDSTIIVSGTGITITLPRADELSTDGGQRLTIKSRDGSTTVQRQGSDTIDGTASFSMTSGQVVNLVSSPTTPSGAPDRWETV